MLSFLQEQEWRDEFPAHIFTRGLNYFRQGRVGDLDYDPVRKCWVGRVLGTKNYQVTIRLSLAGFSSECNCPAAEKYGHPCKHVAAVLLKMSESMGIEDARSLPLNRNIDPLELQRIQDEEWFRQMREIERERKEKEQARLQQFTNQLIQTFAALSDNEAAYSVLNKTFLKTDWIVKTDPLHLTGKKFLTIEMKIGPKRTYVVKEIREFLKAVKYQTQYPFNKNFIYDPTEHDFSEEDREIITLLLETIKYEEAFGETLPSYLQGRNTQSERFLLIPPMIADKLLTKLAGREMIFHSEGRQYNTIEFSDGKLPLSIQLEQGPEDYFQLDLQNLMNFLYFDLYGVLIYENQIYKADTEQQVILHELSKLLHSTQKDVLPISNEQIEPFISQVAPQLGKIGKLEISEKVSSKIVKYPLKAHVYVDRNEDVLQVSLEFHYGENKINPFESDEERKNGPIILRDADKEQKIMDLIESASLRFNGEMLYAAGEEEIFEFLYEMIPLLEKEAEVFVTSSVKSLLFSEHLLPETRIELDSSGNWLEVSFDISGIEQEEIQKILQSVVEKKKYYRLPDGAFIPLDSEEFSTVRNMFEQLNVKPQELQREKLQLPVYRGIQLNEIVGNGKYGRTKYSKNFRRLLNSLKNPEELEFPVPTALNAELRDYQNYGFQWLKTLSRYHLGGILADDMGLGKTLQTIAYLLSEKEESRQKLPSLVVVPSSLVYNWKNELERFAPNLTTEVIIGTPKDRRDKIKRSSEIDIWITSYPTLRQDMEFYKKRQFHTLILDEAQAIKNYTTKTARAVRDIDARTRFALSGTPIENSVDELWSIFQTLMPDFFPPLNTFRHIEPEKIGKMIRPFLLRRVKGDVLKELPEKIETVNYSDLTFSQKELYLAYLERIKRETKESLAGEGFQKSRIKILAGLTRLRQLCCHPSLFIENYRGDSGKLEQLMEIIHNARQNGRRMLVFSQFTGMLGIILRELEKAGIEFFYLDGQTPSKERVEMVERFNQGEHELFLVSLKAGNTGLNLTGADTVILYDLWWNPAVEEQAAGRAHRIGQKKVVQVIRLITQGTIEEKIYKLQQNKKELIDTVIRPDEQALSAITEEDIREILSL